MKKLGWYLFGIAFALIIGVVIGWWVTHDSGAAKKVSSQLILTALHDRGFLVTQTYVFDEPLTIDASEQNFWKNFLWGQVIKAHGVVEVNLGIDLSKVGEGDVTVAADKVAVRVPKAQLFNSRLVGQIEVENSQGILKRLFDNDDGYNQALSEITAQAESAALTDEMLARANESATQEIGRLLGYVVTDRAVEVVIK